MLRSIPIWITLWATSTALFLAEIDSSKWLNTKYQRTLDLSRSYTKESDIIRITNISPTPQTDYYFTLNDGFGFINGLSAISVQLGKAKLTLPTEEFPLEDDPTGNNRIYKVILPIAISPGSDADLYVNYVYIEGVEAYPAKLALLDTQELLLMLNKVPFSPYVSKDYVLKFSGLVSGQEMELLLETTGLNQFGNSPIDVSDFKPVVSGSELVYGPLTRDVPPYSLVSMGLHFEHNRPLARVENLNRSIWIPASSVDQLPVEEYYELTNVGAELNGGFSRADWMIGRYEGIRNHWALSHLEFPLANGESYNDYYYSDLVGVVSTHSIVQENLLLQPRFPLFGGWHYNFTLGWNAVASDHIHKSGVEADTYIVKAPLINTLKDATYKNTYLTFYLPEGSEYVSLASAVPYKSIDIGREFSYLDVEKGHVKVTVHFTNLFESLHNVDLYLVYKYPKASYLWRVGKISGFVFVGLVSYYLLGLINISIAGEAAA